MEEIKNLKVNKIYILIAITIAAILLIIEGIVLFDAIKNIIKESEPPNNSMPPIKFKPTSQILDNEAYCQQDSDCVLVMSDGCCPVCEIKEAINIQVNQKRAEKNQEQCAKKDFACVACVPEIGKKKAVCEQSRCVAKENQVNANINRNGNGGGVESSTGIYLEQKEYKIGENIAGTIRNLSNINLVVIKTSVERLSAKGWKEVKNDLSCGVCGVKCERTNVVIRPHRVKEFSWNQETDEVNMIPNSCKKADGGRYRVKLNYYLYDDMIGANQAADNIYLYSEEFTTL